MSGRGRHVCLVLAVLLLLLALIPAWLWLRIRDGLQEQTAAERWRGSNEERFAQVSCFLDDNAALEASQEYSIRQSLDMSLAGESEASWIMALSGSDEVSVSGPSAQLTARGIYTAGSFGHFHDIRMLSGAWYDPEDVNADGVVIDMLLAWKLFGGYDLRGLTIRINGVSVPIVGVASLPESGIEQAAYGQTPTVWFSARLAERMGIQPRVTCVEAVLPDPVSHFAAEKLSNALGLGQSQYELVENTGRFGLVNSLQVFLHQDSRVMRTSRVAFPYWENAARAAETRCGFCLAVMVLLLLFPAFPVLYWLRRGILALGALRVLRGKVKALTYTGKPVWNGFPGVEF